MLPAVGGWKWEPTTQTRQVGEKVNRRGKEVSAHCCFSTTVAAADTILVSGGRHKGTILHKALHKEGTKAPRRVCWFGKYSQDLQQTAEERGEGGGGNSR